MRICSSAVLLLTLMAATGASAQLNMGNQKAEASLPFAITKVASFDTQVWRIAFLPDGRFLATEKGGRLWLMTQQGAKTAVANVPAVLYQGQGGLLGVFVSPNYAADRYVYLTYSEPHEEPGAPPIPPAAAVPPAGPPAGRGGGPRPTPCPSDPTKVCGSSLAMARARLTMDNGTARLDDLQVLWRDPAGGRGGQFGAQIAFAPDGRSLFLSVGDRQRMTPAQDPDSPLGKILHLTLDGKPAPGNPFAGQPSAQSLPIIDPPRDTEVAKTAPVVRTFTYPASQPNMTRAETWSIGHRTPYGMAFAPNGQLWVLEHGPGGGDKLNLIEPGKNYGWPLAGYGPNYNKVPVPTFDNQPNLTRAVIQWTPVIGPGMLTFYRGAMFPQWSGSALAGGMTSKSLTRIVFDGKGGAEAAERWDISFGVRDGQVAPDGALWISEGGLNNNLPGNIYRVTPQ